MDISRFFAAESFRYGCVMPAVDMQGSEYARLTPSLASCGNVGFHDYKRSTPEISALKVMGLKNPPTELNEPHTPYGK